MGILLYITTVDITYSYKIILVVKTIFDELRYKVNALPFNFQVSLSLHPPSVRLSVYVRKQALIPADLSQNVTIKSC